MIPLRPALSAALIGLLAILAPLALAEPMPATGSVEVAFTPWDDAEGLLLRSLRDARRSVQVQAYVLSSRNIANVLQEAHARGLEVRILADRDQVEKGDVSLVAQLAAAGIPVRLETRYSAAHNKVMLLDAESDQPVLLTGSYNYSWSAQARNAENLLVMRGNPALTQAYLRNWQRHWDEATPMAMNASAPAVPRSARKSTNSPCPWLSPEERRLLGSECRSR